jgi:HK97 family phage portal protein
VISVPFVVNSGQIASLKPSLPTLLATQPSVQLSPTTFMTYEAIWRAQPALRTVVGFLARNIAELDIHVFKKLSQTDRQRVDDHPLARLLAQPYPGTGWTTYRLISWTVHELCIYDTAYWLKVQPPLPGSAGGLIPLPARFVTPQGTNLWAPDSYRITGQSGFQDFPAEQVVHFHGYSPDDPRIGVSPIETLAQILAEEFAANQYREQLWRNGARVSGYITRPKDAPRWSNDARDRFQRGWSRYEGEAATAGKTPILEDGMTYNPSSVTPREAQYAESRQLTREEVAVAYYVNPVMLGLLKQGPGGAVPAIHKMLYADTFGPWLQQLAQDIETQLLIDLDPGGVGSVYVEFNLRRKMQGSFEEQAAAISASVGAPWMTRNEARALQNLPELPEATDLIVPLNVTKGGLANPRDTAPDNPSNAESNGQPPGPKPPNLDNAQTDTGQGG